MTEQRAHLAVDQTGKEVIVPELALQLYDHSHLVPATADQEPDQTAYKAYCRLRSGGLTARDLRLRLSPSF